MPKPSVSLMASKRSISSAIDIPSFTLAPSSTHTHASSLSTMLDDLAPELVLAIVAFLEPHSALRLRAASRRLHALISRAFYWQQLCNDGFGASALEHSLAGSAWVMHYFALQRVRARMPTLLDRSVKGNLQLAARLYASQALLSSEVLDTLRSSLSSSSSLTSSAASLTSSSSSLKLSDSSNIKIDDGLGAGTISIVDDVPLAAPESSQQQQPLPQRPMALEEFEALVRLLGPESPPAVDEPRSDLAIHVVAALDCVSGLKVLLDNGANVQALNYSLQTPLHVAARSSALSAVQFLLTALTPHESANDLCTSTATTSTTSPRSNNVLHSSTPALRVSALTNSPVRGSSSSRQRLTASTDVTTAASSSTLSTSPVLLCSSINAVDINQQTPLHLACGFEASRDSAKQPIRPLLRLLVRYSADIHAGNKYGSTPLHLAAINENYPAAIELVQLGADINLRDNKGMSPRDFASQRMTRALGSARVREGATDRCTLS